MRTNAIFSLLAGFFALALAGAPATAAPGLANLELPRESPVGKLSQQVGLTEIGVEYGSPAVSGRKIWGALVPFDKLWSLGGYQAAKIRFSRDVTLGDKPVPAGTYAFFAIPGKTSWTVILNKNADQLGSAHDYRPDLDVARIQLHPKSSPFREHLAFAIPDFSDDGATLELAWEKVKVALPIKVNTTEEVLTNISSLDNTWRAYANAARYMLETKKDYEQGLKYADQSLALREDWYNLWIKALLLGTRGSYKDAGTAAERALELGLKAGDPLFPEQELRKALASWSQKSVAAR
jgi:tetratricopeptide (TPR) repeat protein